MVPAQRRDRLRRALPPDFKITSSSCLCSCLPSALQPGTCRTAACEAALVVLVGAAVAGSVASSIGRPVARAIHVARATLVVGAEVLAIPTGVVQEVARAAATTAGPSPSATDAVPIPSRPTLGLPTSSPSVLEEGAWIPTAVVVGGPSPSAASPVAVLLRAARTMTTVAAATTSRPRAYATARPVRQLQGPEAVT